MTHGFVYVLSNDAMPGLLKIGCTGGSPFQRAQEISTAAGVPVPFKVLAYWHVKNSHKWEAIFHDELRDYRENDRREFFRLEYARVKQVADDYGLDDMWEHDWRFNEEEISIKLFMLERYVATLEAKVKNV